MRELLRRYRLSGRDIALAVLTVAGIVGAGVLNYHRAVDKNGEKDTLLLQVVTTRPVFPGANITAKDVAVRLRPQVANGFSYADEVANRRAAKYIKFGTTLTEQHLDDVADVSGLTTFVVKMSPPHSVNAAPGTWITLVRSGKTPPMPIGLFHVCARTPVADNVDHVTLEACQMADAVAILSQVAGTGEWIPIPVDTKHSCL